MPLKKSYSLSQYCSIARAKVVARLQRRFLPAFEDNGAETLPIALAPLHCMHAAPNPNGSDYDAPRRSRECRGGMSKIVCCTEIYRGFSVEVEAQHLAEWPPWRAAYRIAGLTGSGPPTGDLGAVSFVYVEIALDTAMLHARRRIDCEQE